MSIASRALSGRGIKQLKREIANLELPEKFEDLVDLGWKTRGFWNEIIDDVINNIENDKDKSQFIHRARFIDIIETSFNWLQAHEEDFYLPHNKSVQVLRFVQEYLLQKFDAVSKKYEDKVDKTKTSQGQTYIDPVYASGVYFDVFLCSMESAKYKPLRDFAAKMKGDGNLVEIRKSDIEKHFATPEYSAAKEILIKESLMWFRESLKTKGISMQCDLGKKYIAQVTSPSNFAEYFLGISLVEKFSKEELENLSTSVWQAVNSVVEAIKTAEKFDIGRITKEVEVAMLSVNEEVIKSGSFKSDFLLKVKNHCFAYLHSQFVDCLQSAGKDSFAQSSKHSAFSGFAHRYLGVKSDQQNDLGISA